MKVPWFAEHMRWLEAWPGSVTAAPSMAVAVTARLLGRPGR